jgi:hypothetical protein
MFLSSDDLKLAYGVQMDIGRFYIDRKIPAGNLYWDKRHLYIPSVPGYYFMPIYADLAYRCGVPKEQLLSETYIQLAEKILDSAARLEGNIINWSQHIEECIVLTKASSNNNGFLQDLIHYFSGHNEKASIPLGTPYPSLNRADAYLFSLCVWNFDDAVKMKLVESWYALMTYFLILDDLVDIKDDFRNKDENALIEAGLTEQGAAVITEMINQNYSRMDKVNPVMANRIDHKRQKLDVAAIIQSFLKQQGSGGI